MPVSASPSGQNIYDLPGVPAVEQKAKAHSQRRNTALTEALKDKKVAKVTVTPKLRDAQKRGPYPPKTNGPKECNVTLPEINTSSMGRHTSMDSNLPESRKSPKQKFPDEIKSFKGSKVTKKDRIPKVYKESPVVPDREAPGKLPQCVPVGLPSVDTGRMTLAASPKGKDPILRKPCPRIDKIKKPPADSTQGLPCPYLHERNYVHTKTEVITSNGPSPNPGNNLTAKKSDTANQQIPAMSECPLPAISPPVARKQVWSSKITAPMKRTAIHDRTEDKTAVANRNRKKVESTAMPRVANVVPEMPRKVAGKNKKYDVQSWENTNCWYIPNTTVYIKHSERYFKNSEC